MGETKEVEKEKRGGGGGVSFINSPAVVATPCWTVNHQWPQNYRHGLPADSKNCLFTAIYGPASRAGPPLSLASPRCAHILTSQRHQLLPGSPADWLTAGCLKATFPLTDSSHLPEVFIEDSQISSERQHLLQITGKVTACVCCRHTGFIEYYIAQQHRSGICKLSQQEFEIRGENIHTYFNEHNLCCVYFSVSCKMKTVQSRRLTTDCYSKCSTFYWIFCTRSDSLFPTSS